MFMLPLRTTLRAGIDELWMFDIGKIYIVSVE